MLSEVEISQYIATKLCHDLAGTIGAISNGIDFIESDNLDMRHRAIDLIRSSSEQAVSRLIFFRQAYGVAKHHGEANLDELKKVVSDYLKDSKVRLDFHEKYFHIPEIFVSMNVGKLMLCIIQHAYTNLIHGGEITVTVEKGDSKDFISISAKGNSPKIDNEKNDILNGRYKEYELTTQNCTSFFALKLAKHLNVEIKTNIEQANQIDYLIYF